MRHFFKSCNSLSGQVSYMLCCTLGGRILKDSGTTRQIGKGVKQENVKVLDGKLPNDNGRLYVPNRFDCLAIEVG